MARQAYYRSERKHAIAADNISDQLPYGDWEPGRWAWRLTGPELFDEPIPAKGRQGVWRWTLNAARAILEMPQVPNPALLEVNIVKSLHGLNDK